MCEGFITLQRKLLNWEWADDPNTLAAWVHILLSANWQDNKWHGITIPRGTVLMSYNKLAAQAGLSVRSARTAIDHLKATGEITCETTRYGMLIKVVNYNKYQYYTYPADTQNDTEFVTETPMSRQGGDKEPTSLEQRNNNNNIKEVVVKTTRRSSGFLKPTVEDVSNYIKDKGYTVNAERFVAYYESNGWKVGKNPMKDWKAAVRTWQTKEFSKPTKEMPDYISVTKTDSSANKDDIAAVKAMQERMKHDRS